MKSTLLLTLTLLLFGINSSATTGGPDSYGYTWIDSNEPGGPTYNWVDISATGTLVTGLTDDNSVPFISMGMDFHYYWGDYSSLKVGSNGWLSFDNTGNIAHCFPVIPTPGGAGNNFIAPFMTDLNFTGAGNPAQVYYLYDAVLDRFIITYENVPWWTAAAPNYAGSNTFQVILANADSSITFQYQTTDVGNFNDQPTCLSDLVIGIEAPTGSIGLSAYQDIIPPSTYAIKFVHPNPVLIQVPDITPFWAVTPSSGGDFRYIGESVQVPVNVKGVGSSDITSDITVDVTIQDQTFTTIATYQQVISGGLNAGDDSTIYFLWVPASVGQYSVEVTTDNVDDINSTNDTLVAEYEILDPTAGVQSRLSYVNVSDLQTGSLAWGSGNNDGGGTHYVPNAYPFGLDSIGGYVMGVGDVIFEVYLDDGVNNTPGTMIHTETFASGSVTLNNWIYSTLSSTYSITSGGLYVVWIQPGGSNTSLGTVLNPPFSRRNVEQISGFADYRDNETQELMLSAHGKSLCASLLGSYAITEPTCNGGTDASIDLTVVGGTSPYTFSWTNGAGTSEDPTGISAGTYVVTITDNGGCDKDQTIVVSEPSAISLSATSTDEISANDGAIDLTATGGTSPYTFSWTGGAGTNEDPIGLAGGVYTVTVTDANGCTETLDVTVNSQLGFEANTSSFNWKVYPVPSEGIVTIQLEKTLGASLEIRNMLGQLVYEAPAKLSQEVIIAEPGVYLAILRTSEGNLIKQVIIK